MSIWRDLVYAFRSLAKARTFTFVCVVTLGVGMVPVIAIPYVSRIVKMPPHVKPEGLVEVVTTSRGPLGARDTWSYPDFMDLRAADTGMDIAGWVGGPGKMAIQTPGGVETKTIPAMFVSANYFKTVGVALARGPGFSDAMDQSAATEAGVILGHRFWLTQLGADPDIIGKILTLNDMPHLVVGIAPETFEGHLFLHGKELFLPIEQHPRLRDRNPENKLRSERSDEWIFIIGRLSPGVGVAQASAAVSAVTSQLAKQYRATNEFKEGIVAAYHPLGTLNRTQFAVLRAIALALTGTVLIVVCLNISGMMQVRNAIRERELSIRQAIGASRGRLVQHLFAESLVLAGLGGTLGSILLFTIPPLVFRLSEEPIPVQFQDALRVDLYMIAICVAVCLITSVVFGLLPARRFSRPVIVSALKDDAGAGGFQVGRIHRLTAALQVAIAVPLIVMGGICLDRVRATATADLGFESDLLYAAPLKLDDAEKNSAGFRIRSVRDNLSQASGVASVTVADGLPLDFAYRITRVALHGEADLASRFVPAHVTRVGDGYLKTMGIALLRGRDFTADDREGAEKVTVISKPLADKLFPNADAIGQRLTLGEVQKTQQTLTIVGVTGDFPTSQMSTERPQLLLPLAQHPSPNVFLIARSHAGEPPTKLTAALENVLHDLDPESRRLTTTDGEPYARVVTGVSLRQKSVDDFLTQSTVAGVSGGVILMLAALGVYGVVGLMVATRTREIAVRIALGASRRRVLAMILLDVVKLVTPGVAIGLILTLALNRLNSENMGISLSNIEPLAYVLGAAVAVLVAVVASVAPARRAASVHPIVAMRSV